MAAHGADSLSALLESLSSSELLTERVVETGRVLFHRGAVVQAMGVVRLGAFKPVRLDAEGRGRLLAFDALGCTEHRSDAAALGGASAWAPPRDSVDAAAAAGRLTPRIAVSR